MFYMSVCHQFDFKYTRLKSGTCVYFVYVGYIQKYNIHVSVFLLVIFTRKCFYIIDEHSRVDLVPIRSVDGSNYINASYIDVRFFSFVSSFNNMEKVISLTSR